MFHTYFLSFILYFELIAFNFPNTLEKLSIISQHDAQDAKKTFWNVSVLILQIVKPMNIYICTTQVHNAQAYSKQYT